MSLPSPAAGTANPLDDVILDVPALAALLDIAPSTTYEAVARGDIPGRRIGKHYRFSKRAVLQWLADGNPRARRRGAR